MEWVIVALFASVFGWSIAPFAMLGNTGDAALIAGIFSTVNVILTAVLNSWTLKEARRNRREIRGARRAAQESIEELHDVKRKVKGERRSNSPEPRPGGRRKGLDGPDDSA